MQTYFEVNNDKIILFKFNNTEIILDGILIPKDSNVQFY